MQLWTTSFEAVDITKEQPVLHLTMPCLTKVLIAATVVTRVIADDFNVLQHLGVMANGSHVPPSLVSFI
jgi:hypothetical protein